MSYTPGLRAGFRLDNGWLIVHVLDAGACGSIYVVHNVDGRRAAMKVLHEAHAGDEIMVERFIREAHAMRSIQHPGVPEVYEEGQLHDGRPYLLMELLEGETTEQRRVRKGGTLPVQEVLWLADQILGILDAAHKAKVLHRDLKPENVFVTYDQDVKLLDFGIARMVAASSQDLTQVGNTLGTPAFMAPEQARGEWTNVGAWTDLWALSACMFNWLSGRLVHEEHDIIQQLRAVALKEAPSLREVVPEMPEPLVLLVDFGLAHAMRGRWRTPTAMRMAVRAAYREWKAIETGRDSVYDEEDRDVSAPPMFEELPPPPATRRPSFLAEKTGAKADAETTQVGVGKVTEAEIAEALRRARSGTGS